MASNSALPTGTLTFLFTDIEGSTRLWEQDPSAMHEAMMRHDDLIESLVAQRAGMVVRPRGEGDSRFAVFSLASNALSAACAIQQALFHEQWKTPTPLRVRMALHSGEADLREGDYYGTAVNRTARLRSLAHGGQVLISQTTRDLVENDTPPGVSLRDLGEHRLKDLNRAERIFQLCIPGVPSEFPPLQSLDVVPNNLPAEVTSFIGRERETGQGKQLLTTPRLLTIIGAGGSGKTRPALHVAGKLAAAGRLS